MKVRRHDDTIILQTKHGEHYLSRVEAEALQDDLHDTLHAMQFDRITEKLHREEERRITTDDLVNLDFAKPV